MTSNQWWQSHYFVIVANPTISNVWLIWPIYIQNLAKIKEKVSIDFDGTDSSVFQDKL